MAAITAPFGVLPMLAYALTSFLIIYLGLRVARYLKSRQSSALPKPVSGAPSKSTTFLGGARSTASSWRQWSQSLPIPHLPRVRVPWVRIPSLSENSFEGVGAGIAKAKNGKNLAIELLPTTGLPPPPSAPIFSPTPTRAGTPALQQQQNQRHQQPQQLIDISSPPSTPELTAASTSASDGSFPGSPRTLSSPQLAPYMHGHPPKAVYTPHPTVHAPVRPAYPRSPSPHALLATTAPVKHKRSRSLGGVPVRRLSGGASSSLRNTVGVEAESESVEMDLLGRKAIRGKGEEQLLIDFSSSGSGSGEASDELDDPFVSPAASDIGVLSLSASSQPALSSVYTAYASSGPYGHSGYKVAPSVVSTAATAAIMATSISLPLRVDARQVGRHVPLVDLSDGDAQKRRAPLTTSSFDEDGWKWFGTSLGASTGRSSAAAKTSTVEVKASVREKEKLVELDNDVPDASGLVSDGAATAVAHQLRENTQVYAPQEDTHKMELLVEVDSADEKEGLLVDVGFGSEDEESRESQAYPPQVPQYQEQYPKDGAYINDVHHDKHRHDIHEHANDIHEQTDDATPETNTSIVSIRSPLPTFAAPVAEEAPIAIVGALSATVSAVRPAEQTSNDASWAWDDPWSGHLVSPDVTRVAQNEDLMELDGCMEMAKEEVAKLAESEAHHVSEVQESPEVVENSPAGLLKATVLDEDDDEGVPVLNLESLDLEAFVPFEAPEVFEICEQQTLTRSVVPVAEQNVQAVDDEEDITPTPTPASSHAKLSPAPLSEATLVNAEAFDEPAEVFYPDPELLQLDDAWQPPSVDSAFDREEVVLEEELFPDPDLLPLPVANDENTENIQDTLDDMRSQLLAIADKGRPSTPTLSQMPTPPASPPPLYPISTSSVSATLLRPVKSRGASRMPSPTATVNNAMAFPVVFPMVEQDKENMAVTPTTSTQQQRPAWSLRASDAPALGLPSSGAAMGPSPRGRRKALEDVNWSVGEQKDEKAVEADVLGKQLQDKEDAEEKVQVAKVETQDMIPSKNADLVAPSLEPSTSLPGSFPDSSPPDIVVSPPAIPSSTSSISFPATSPISKDSDGTTSPTATSKTTVAQRIRRASLTAHAWTMPSARTLVRSPLDIALAMQMRPGLGAGADPAWMVRFLMAVYGCWLASLEVISRPPGLSVAESW